MLLHLSVSILLYSIHLIVFPVILVTAISFFVIVFPLILLGVILFPVILVPAISLNVLPFPALFNPSLSLLVTTQYFEGITFLCLYLASPSASSMAPAKEHALIAAFT